MSDKIKQLADNLESSLSPLLEDNEQISFQTTNLNPGLVISFISRPIGVVIYNDPKHIRVMIQKEYHRGIEGDRFTCEILTIGREVKSLKFNKKTDTIEKIEKYVIDKMIKFINDQRNINQSMKLTESQENNIINELFGSKHKVFYLDQRTKRMHSFGVDRNPDVLSPADIAKQFALVKGEEVGYFSCSKVGTNEERGIELLELKPKEKSPDYNNMIVFQNAKSMWSAKKAALDAGYIKFFSKSIF
jgi:hypothetical protein